ncbi:oligosaccharide flippase family protein [Candidatus Saccharibacteria bacterium]|nr:oligosaccharide flippase family protein [Candidatus Saccharibacteria bacterium]
MLQRINKWVSHGSVLVKTSPFLRHNAVFLTGSLGVASLNYLFYPILGRLMSPADFGEVQTLTSLFTQAAIFLTILTYVTIHVTVNTLDEKERNQTLLGLEKIAMIVGYSLLLIALLLVDQLRTFLNFTEIWPFVALMAALAFSIPLAFRMAFLRGKKQFLQASLTDGTGSAVKLLLAPIFVLLGYHSFGAIGALAVSQVLSLIVGLVWARKAGFYGSAFGTAPLRLDLIKPYLKHAVAILLGVGGVTVIQTLDIIAIKHYFSPTEAGLYAGITIIAGIVYFLMAPVTAVLITMVSTNQSLQKNQARLKASLALMLLLGGEALLAMNLFPEIIINILVGSKYLSNAIYLPRVGLMMLFLAIANMFMMYHIALKRYKYCLVSIPICAVVLALMQLNHGKIEDVINNIVLGSFILLVITGLQNFLFNHHQLREDNA